MSTPVGAVVGSGEGEPPAVVPAPHRRRFSRGVREAGLGYLLLLPAFLIFAVFIFYPFFRNFYLGFFSTPPFPGQPKNYVGLDQYKDVLTSSEFLDSLKVTVIFAVITVPVGIALGILLAVLAHQKLKGVGIYRAFFSSTVATSIAVASVIFGTLLSPQVGLLQGIQTEPSILQNPDPIINISLPVIRSFIPSIASTRPRSVAPRFASERGLQSCPPSLPETGALQARRAAGEGTVATAVTPSFRRIPS